MKLDTQVFVSHTKPQAHLVEPVVNGEDLFWKPRRGGMWTSTLDEEGGEWVRWLKGEEQSLGSDYSLDSPRWGGKLWLLTPAEANVYAVTTPTELIDLHRRFPLHVPEALLTLKTFNYMIDWEAVAREYDGVWVPNPWPWRLGGFGGWRDDPETQEIAHAASMFFYVMDAECTCWFRWCFEGEPQLLDSVPAGKEV